MTITASARARLRELLDNEEGIRVFLSSGGSCPSVALDIVGGPEPGDTRHEQDSFILYLEKDIVGVHRDLTIDYADKMGFMIAGMPKSLCCNKEEGR